MFSAIKESTRAMPPTRILFQNPEGNPWKTNGIGYLGKLYAGALGGALGGASPPIADHLMEHLRLQWKRHDLDTWNGIIGYDLNADPILDNMNAEVARQLVPLTDASTDPTTFLQFAGFYAGVIYLHWTVIHHVQRHKLSLHLYAIQPLPSPDVDEAVLQRAVATAASTVWGMVGPELQDTMDQEQFLLHSRVWKDAFNDDGVQPKPPVSDNTGTPDGPTTSLDTDAEDASPTTSSADAKPPASKPAASNIAQQSTSIDTRLRDGSTAGHSIGARDLGHSIGASGGDISSKHYSVASDTGNNTAGHSNDSTSGDTVVQSNRVASAHSNTTTGNNEHNINASGTNNGTAASGNTTQSAIAPANSHCEQQHHHSRLHASPQLR